MTQTMPLPLSRMQPFFSAAGANEGEVISTRYHFFFAANRVETLQTALAVVVVCWIVAILEAVKSLH